MRIVYGILLSGFMGFTAYGKSYPQSLKEVLSYQSPLSCSADSDTNCFANKSFIGLALDMASQAGLEIIEIKIVPGSIERQGIFVESAKFGRCFVSVQEQDDEMPLRFFCSSAEKEQKVDRVFALAKIDDEQFELINVSPKQILRR